MNILFFTDLHIDKYSLEECSNVLKEILSISERYKIDKVFNAGDTFDSLHPSSEEFDLFADFIVKLNKEIVIIAADSHESESRKNSLVNHFSLLNNKVTICKQYEDLNNLYVGHFIVNESKNNYGGTVSKAELSKYKYVVLGHGHRPEIIQPNITQLGSCRYVDFAESEDYNKHVLLIENYASKDEKCTFLPLSSYYPMNDVYFSKSLKSQAQSTRKTHCFKTLSTVLAYLDKLDSKMKIRVIFDSFDSWLEFRPHYDKYSDKFILFRDRKDFTLQSIMNDKKNDKSKTFRESLEEYMKSNSISETIQKCLLKEI